MGWGVNKTFFFRVRSAVFLNRTFLVWTQTFRQSFSFFESYLSIFSSQSFPLLQVSPSHFFDSGPPIFTGQSFSLFYVILSHFSSQTFPIFWSVRLLFPVRSSQFFGQPFPLSQVSPCNFSSQTSFAFSSLCPFNFFLFCLPIWSPCTLLTKLKMSVGVFRKRLPCTTNSLVRETNQRNTNRQAREREK